MSGDVVDRLGELLREAGFGGAHQSDLQRVPGGVPPAAILAAVGRTQHARLATLVTLLGQDEPTDRPEAERALAPLAISDLMDAGVLEAVGSAVRARTMLAAFDGLILAGDPPRLCDRRDYVVNVSPASRTIANVTVRRRVASALDLGAGSGVHALLAARHAEQVTGVDINPHALALARLSQRMSRIDNVEWAEGDWFDAARDSRFDLIVSAPPVVISPDNTMLYRDSEFDDEELSRRLVGEIGGHLKEGGHATVLCNWPHSEGDWSKAPREWATGLGCDAVLLKFGTHGPLEYALSMITDRPSSDPAVVAETVTRWLRHYESRDIERIAVGVLVLRRNAEGPNWSTAFEIPGGPSGPGGEQLERMLAGGDFLARHTSAAQLRELMSTAWRLAEGHRLDQSLTYEAGAYKQRMAVMSSAPGLGLSAEVDPRAVPVLLGCDGHRPLSALLRDAALPDDLDKSGFHSLCLTTVRDLIARGYLAR